MRILIIEQIPEGPFLPQYFFEGKKHNVRLCDITKFYSFKYFLFLKKINKKIWLNIVSSYIFKHVSYFKPEVILFYNLDYIDNGTLLEIKNLLPKIKLICWHGDDLFNPRFDVDSQNIKIPIIDTHVTPRSHLANDYLSKNAREVICVNWYPKVLRLTPSKTIFDVSFFGSIDQKRQNYLHNFNYEDFILGGYGWNNKNIKAKKYFKHVSLNLMNELISKSKTSLNFLTEANRDRTNFRNFEIPSQFSLQISERSDEICDIFKEDVGVVCFQSVDELNDKIKFYLKNDSLRDSIILNSHNIISDKKYSLDFQLEILNNRIVSF